MQLHLAQCTGQLLEGNTKKAELQHYYQCFRYGTTSVLRESPLLKNIADTATIRTVISGFRGPLVTLLHIYAVICIHHRAPSGKGTLFSALLQGDDLPPLAPRGGNSLAREMTTTTPIINQRFRTSCNTPDKTIACVEHVEAFQIRTIYSNIIAARGRLHAYTRYAPL